MVLKLDLVAYLFCTMKNKQATNHIAPSREPLRVKPSPWVPKVDTGRNNTTPKNPPDGNPVTPATFNFHPSFHHVLSIPSFLEILTME